MPHVTGKLKRQALLVGKAIEAMRHPVLNFSRQHRIDGLLRAFLETSSGGMDLLPTYRLQRRAVGDAENPARHLRCEAKIVGVAPISTENARAAPDGRDITPPTHGGSRQRWRSIARYRTFWRNLWRARSS